MGASGTVAVICTVLLLLAIWFVLRKQKNPALKWFGGLAQTAAIALALMFLVIWPFIVQAFYIPSGSMKPTVEDGDRLIVNKFLYRVRTPARGEVAVFLAPKEASEGDGDPRGPRQEEFIKRVAAMPGDVVRITAGYVIAGSIEYNHDEIKAALAKAFGSSTDVPVKLTDKAVLYDGKQVDSIVLSTALTGFPYTPISIHPGVFYVNGRAVDEPYCPEDSADPYPLPGVNKEWNYFDNGQPAVKIPSGQYLMLGDNRNDSRDSRTWGLLDGWRFNGKAWFVFWPLNRCRIVK